MGKIKVCLLRSSSASKGVIKLGIRTFYNYYYFETMDTGFWAYRGYLSTENHFLKIRQKSFSISKAKTLFGKMGMGSKLAKLDTSFLESQKHGSHHRWTPCLAQPYVSIIGVRQVETSQKKSKLAPLEWQLPCSPLPSCIIRQLRLVITRHQHFLILYSLSKRSHLPPLTTLLLLLLVSLLHMLICLCL